MTGVIPYPKRMRKDIPGLEGRYQADSEGFIVSLLGVKERVLKPYRNPNDPRNAHLRVALHKDGMQKTFPVHTLVAQCFLPQPEVGQEILHKDGNHENCSADNLKWGTRSENTFDQVKHGRHNNARKTHCKRGHEFTPENTFLRPEGGRACKECRRASREKWAAANR